MAFSTLKGVAVFSLGVLVGMLMFATHTLVRNGNQLGRPPLLRQAIASAVYQALMQVDCDQTDSYSYANSNCNDELQNVNVAPTIQSITIKGNVATIVVDMVLTGNGTMQIVEREILP